MFTLSQINRLLDKYEATADSLIERISPEGSGAWDAKRKGIAVQQILLTQEGRNPGKIDGYWGPQTQYAFDLWKAKDKDALATFKETKPPPKASIIPKTSPWPKQDVKAMDKFFGAKGTNQGSLKLPFRMRIAWNKSQFVSSITLNEKVLESAGRCFDKIASRYNATEREKLGLDIFGGSLNVRRMRGGTSWSIHSWGCAIDFDPERNQLKWGKPRSRLSQSDAIPFWEIWEEEGWVSLGRARNYDWMHVQAAKL